MVIQQLRLGYTGASTYKQCMKWGKVLQISLVCKLLSLISALMIFMHAIQLFLLAFTPHKISLTGAPKRMTYRKPVFKAIKGNGAKKVKNKRQTNKNCQKLKVRYEESMKKVIVVWSKKLDLLDKEPASVHWL